MEKNITIIWYDDFPETWGKTETINFILHIIFGNNEKIIKDILINNLTLINEKHIFDSNGRFINIIPDNTDMIIIYSNIGNRLQFYGIKYVEFLRLNNIKCPIIIASLFSREKLINDHHFVILNFNGHYLIKIPNINNLSIHNLSPVDDMELDDIKFHACDVTGVVSTLFHDLKNIIRYKKEEPDNVKRDIIIIELYKVFKILEFYPHSKKILEEIIQRIRKKEETIESFLYTESNEFLRFLTKEESYSGDMTKRDWKILWLDDQPITGVLNDFRQLLIKEFGFPQNNIVIKQNYEESIKEIENDVNNEYCVIVTDYRLKKHNGELHKYQGYHFIKSISEKNDRFQEIIVLSGLDKEFIYRTFGKFNLKVDIYSKDLINDKTGKYELGSRIVRGGDEILNIIANQPSSIGWEKIKSHYISFRKSVNYLWQLQEIYNTVNKIRKDIDKIFKNNILEEINEIDKIDKFTSELSGKNKKNNELIFRNKIAGRILYWYMTQYIGIRDETAVYLLMNGIWKSEFSKKEHTRIRQAKFKNALVEDDFYSNLLIEEKNWFKYELKIPVEVITTSVLGIVYKYSLKQYFNNPIYYNNIDENLRIDQIQNNIKSLLSAFPNKEKKLKFIKDFSTILFRNMTLDDYSKNLIGEMWSFFYSIEKEINK